MFILQQKMKSLIVRFTVLIFDLSDFCISGILSALKENLKHFNKMNMDILQVFFKLINRKLSLSL